MAERRLRIAADLTLPLEAVTETFAILAKRGVGKTYTGAVLAEEMVGAGAQVVILDPLDAWWGLRSSADGSGDGLPIYVFGGEHGDLALEATAGELLADVVVDHGISAIFSTRHLSKSKQRQFITDFAERLYHRKGEPEHRTPLHVFIDEADAFVPQGTMRDTARMVGAIDDIVRRGRNAGLGVTLISQRAAVVNKDVLTQCEVLVALRTISPQDRKALDAWVEAHDAHDQRAAFMASLAGLDVGEAWVWSPGWLDIFQRVRIRPRRTFDSSATPKAGARPAQPKQRADVNLEQLGERIAATIETSKANDPRELRRRISELERQLEQRPTEQVVETVTERIEVPVLNGQVPRLEKAVAGLRDVGEQLVAASVTIVEAADGITAAIDRVASAKSAPAAIARPPRPATPAPRPIRHPSPAAAATAVLMPPDTDVKLGQAERTFLAAIVQYPSGLTPKQLSLLSGYSAKSGHFANVLGRLRSSGLIQPGQPLMATDAGAVHPQIADVKPLPAPGPELVDYWMGRLGRAERAFLEIFVADYPNEVGREALAERTGYSSQSGHFANVLGRLRTLGLIEGWRASEDLVG